MIKYPRLIQFDGLRGVGKTTQAKLMSKYLRSIGYDVEYLKLSDFDSIMSCMKHTVEVLNGTQKIIVQDGSIAREIIEKMAKGISRANIMEGYKEELRLLETVYHKYTVKGLILLNTDLTVCQERLEKQSKILGLDLKKINNLLEEGTVLNLFMVFDDNTISKSNKFQSFLHSDESILDIHEEIMKSF